jgi:hypothetical protein
MAFLAPTQPSSGDPHKGQDLGLGGQVSCGAWGLRSNTHMVDMST